VQLLRRVLVRHRLWAVLVPSLALAICLPGDLTG